MTVLNELLRRTFDLVLLPFRELPPLAALSALSLVTAVAMLVVFKATSDQRRLAEVKRAIVAALFEVRLFNDDLGAVFRAQGEILRHNLTYLRLSLVPMLWLVVPLGLAVAHLDFYFGYAGFTPGQPVLVTAHVRQALKPAADVRPVSTGHQTDDAAATLDGPPELRVMTPAVWLPAKREVVWRVVPTTRGEFTLDVGIDGQRFTKTFDVTTGLVGRSPARVAAGLVPQLLSPAERPLPRDGAATEIRLPYPRRGVRLFGREAPWLLVYFALSMAFAFVLRKPFGVTL